MLIKMCLKNCLPCSKLCIAGYISAFGLVKEDELARWSFDEGNGSIANDSLNGGSPLYMNSGTWGNEDEGNALSKFSMDISEGTGFG